MYLVPVYPDLIPPHPLLSLQMNVNLFYIRQTCFPHSKTCLLFSQCIIWFYVNERNQFLTDPYLVIDAHFLTTVTESPETLYNNS